MFTVTTDSLMKNMKMLTYIMAVTMMDQEIRTNEG